MSLGFKQKSQFSPFPYSAINTATEKLQHRFFSPSWLGGFKYSRASPPCASLGRLLLMLCSTAVMADVIFGHSNRLERPL